MTTQKDFKRIVRARMLKTGEAYTAARAQLLKKKPAAGNGDSRIAAPKRAVATAAFAVPTIDPKDYAKLAGMSDAAIKKGTGCGWDKWVKSLDHNGAQNMSHTEIAELTRKKYKAPPWWSQMVAVGYERIRGLRVRGQQRDGSYQASKSRTFNVPVDVLFDAWTDPSTRRKWLDEPIKVRTAKKPKSMRIDFPGAGILSLNFLAKGKSKSSVAVDQVKMESKEAVAAMKEEWSERFDRLAELLKTEDGRQKTAGD
jgi:hypothetical protein